MATSSLKIWQMTQIHIVQMIDGIFIGANANKTAKHICTCTFDE